MLEAKRGAAAGGRHAVQVRLGPAGFLEEMAGLGLAHVALLRPTPWTLT